MQNNTYYYISRELNRVPKYLLEDPRLSVTLRIVWAGDIYANYIYKRLNKPYVINDESDYVILINPDEEIFTLLSLLGLTYKKLTALSDYEKIYNLLQFT